MSVGSLLARAVFNRKPLLPGRAALRAESRAGVWRSAEQSLPPGVAEVEAEIRAALAAHAGAARESHIDLQVACTPRLCAQADPASLRICLRELVAAAIARAATGVLVTSTEHAGAIEITILDDGVSAPGATETGAPPADILPKHARFNHGYTAGRGSVITLGVPLAAIPDRTTSEASVALY